MGELSKMINIGKTLEAQLHEAGCKTPEDLVRLGSRETWLRIRANDPSA